MSRAKKPEAKEVKKTEVKKTDRSRQRTRKGVSDS
jgi:hypothetical protein